MALKYPTMMNDNVVDYYEVLKLLEKAEKLLAIIKAQQLLNLIKEKVKNVKH